MRMFALFLALGCAFTASADDLLEIASVQLMQPENVIGERSTADELVAWTKRVETAARESLLGNAGAPRSGYLVLAARAGGNSRAWTDFDPADARDAALVSAAESVKGPAVNHGTVLIALALRLDGAAAPEQRTPSPQAWRDAMKGRDGSFSLEQVADIVWPMSDSEAAARPEFEYVEETLAGLGATIERPRDWYVTTSKDLPMWTISLEDASDGKRYETGMRVQWVSPAKQLTGKTPKQLVKDFIKAHKANASKVIDCGEQKMHGMTRACLETEEGPFHIMYSMFYSDRKADFAIIITTGAPIALWDKYAPVFTRMAALRFDPKE